MTPVLCSHPVIDWCWGKGKVIITGLAPSYYSRATAKCAYQDIELGLDMFPHPKRRRKGRELTSDHQTTFTLGITLIATCIQGVGGGWDNIKTLYSLGTLCVIIKVLIEVKQAKDGWKDSCKVRVELNTTLTTRKKEK